MSPTVAVLAGGDGKRIGGDKAVTLLAGLPLVTYPLRAAADAGLSAVVVAKRRTTLPPLRVPVIHEHDAQPTHPLVGILAALARYPSVLALPCDMPLVSAELLAALARASGDLVVPSAQQPFPGRYGRALVPELERTLAARGPMRSILARAGAVTLEDVDPDLLRSVNTPADLELVERLLMTTPPAGGARSELGSDQPER